MRKIILSFLLFFCPLALHAVTLEQRIAQAQSGDFIVTAQENNYSLLFVRSLTSDTLLLEEISVPTQQIDLKKINWKDWAAQKAPGHTSWTLYEIDRKTGKLIECFSYSKNGWLYLEESELFLTKLLTLRLDPVSENERKKIGLQPVNEQEDHRAVWNPPLFIEGKKVAKPSFDVLKAHWPDDGSRLSRCLIELYFIKDFPLPYWIDVQSPHYAFKLRTVDSGHDLISAMTGPMPHRAPKILGMMQKEVAEWKLAVQTPSYFQKLHLYVIDLTQESKAMTAIPFSKQPGDKKEEWILEITTSELNKALQKGHRYRWVLVPEGSGEIYVESEETFSWK